MTKKDYVLIAKTINNVYLNLGVVDYFDDEQSAEVKRAKFEVVERVVSKLVEKLGEQKPKFQPLLFKKICLESEFRNIQALT